MSDVAKHTPGPWSIAPWGHGLDFRSDWRTLGRCHHTAVGLEQAVANARLIVAAPGLLSACEEAAERLEGSDHRADQEFRGRLLDLIAKATGAT